MNSSSGDCRDVIRRLNELNASYSNSALSDFGGTSNNENELNLNQFNDIYNSQGSNLAETVNFLPETEQSPQTAFFELSNYDLKSENSELKNEIERLKTQCSSLQTKIGKYETAILKFHRKLSDETVKNEALSSQIVALNVTVDSLRNSAPQIINQKIELDSILDNISSMVKYSSQENKKIVDQRDSLLKIIQKQNDLLDIYDQKLISKVKANAPPKKINTEPITDEIDSLYTVLGAVTRLGSTNENISKISEDSSKTVQDRIISIFQLVMNSDGKEVKKSTNNTSNSNNNTNAFVNDFKNLANKDFYCDTDMSEHQQRSLRVLSVMDEELAFLLQLGQSSDLQSIVFPNETKLNICFKQQLIEHCAKLGQFVEQMIPRVSLNSEIDKIPHLNIFKILEPTDISEKVNQVYESINKSSNISTGEENREVFQLFVSEVVVSSILKRFSMECKLRYENIRKKMNEMQDAVDKTRSLSKELKTYHEREEKMRQMLSSMFDINPKTDFLDIFNAVIKYFQNQNENLPIISDLKTALTQTNKEHSKEIRELKKACKKELINLQKQNNESNKKVDIMITEKKELQDQIETYKKKIENAELQLKDAQNYKSDKNNKLINDIELQNKEYIKRIGLLEDQLNEKVNKYAEACNTIGILKTEILKYKKRISELEKIAKDSMNLVTVKTGELKSQYERTIHTLQNKIKENSHLEEEFKQNTLKYSNLESENKRLKMENKTLEMQIKSSEEKWGNEMKALSGQLSAQLNAASSKYTTSLSQISYHIESFASKIGHSVMISGESDLPSVLDSLSDLILKDLRLQGLYSEFYKTITKLQPLLDANSPEKLVSSIQSMIDNNRSLSEQVVQLQNRIQQEYLYIQKMKQHDNENTEKLIELKQWEIWAKRQIRNRNSSQNIPHDQMRRIIEEELWSSGNSSSYAVNVDNEIDDVDILISNHNSNDPSPILRRRNSSAQMHRPKTLLPGILPSD